MFAPLALMLILPCANSSAVCAAGAPLSSAAAETAAPAADAAPAESARFSALPPAQILYEAAGAGDFSYYSEQNVHIIWSGPSLLSHAAFELKPARIYTMPPREAAILRVRPAAQIPQAKAAFALFA